MHRLPQLLIGIFLGTATVASADVPLGQGPSNIPSTAPNAPARVNSPYWNNGQQQGGDLPAVDIRAVPVAHANAVAARWTFNQSLTDLSNATRIMQMQMEARPEYVKAMAGEKIAYDAMQDARRNALAPLSNNAAYNGAEKLRSNLVEQIADENYAETPDTSRLTALAKLKLDYVRDNRKLEAATLQRDQNYQDARQRYVAAGQHVLELRREQALAVATDESLQSIRKQVADARITRLATEAFYESAIIARNGAVDYALLYRGVDIYHGYGNGYAPIYTGYGYGY